MLLQVFARGKQCKDIPSVNMEQLSVTRATRATSLRCQPTALVFVLSMFLFQMFFFPLTGKMSTSEFLPTHCLHWWFTWVVTVKQLVLSRELKSTSPQETSGLPQWLSGKEPACNAADAGEVTSAPGSGRSPGGRNGNPLQDHCLENPADRGAWRATVHGVAKSRTWLSDRTHTHTHTQRRKRQNKQQTRCMYLSTDNQRASWAELQEGGVTSAGLRQDKRRYCSHFPTYMGLGKQRAIWKMSLVYEFQYTHQGIILRWVFPAGTTMAMFLIIPAGGSLKAKLVP